MGSSLPVPPRLSPERVRGIRDGGRARVARPRAALCVIGERGLSSNTEMRLSRNELSHARDPRLVPPRRGRRGVVDLCSQEAPRGRAEGRSPRRGSPPALASSALLPLPPRRTLPPSPARLPRPGRTPLRAFSGARRLRYPPSRGRAPSSPPAPPSVGRARLRPRPPRPLRAVCAARGAPPAAAGALPATRTERLLRRLFRNPSTRARARFCRRRRRSRWSLPTRRVGAGVREALRGRSQRAIRVVVGKAGLVREGRQRPGVVGLRRRRDAEWVATPDGHAGHAGFGRCGMMMAPRRAQGDGRLRGDADLPVAPAPPIALRYLLGPGGVRPAMAPAVRAAPCRHAAGGRARAQCWKRRRLQLVSAERLARRRLGARPDAAARTRTWRTRTALGLLAHTDSNGGAGTHLCARGRARSAGPIGLRPRPLCAADGTHTHRTPLPQYTMCRHSSPSSADTSSRTPRTALRASMDRSAQGTNQTIAAVLKAQGALSASGTTTGAGKFVAKFAQNTDRNQTENPYGLQQPSATPRAPLQTGALGHIARTSCRGP